MASNSNGPTSPLEAAEAERLAAQFRPVWDVESPEGDEENAGIGALPHPGHTAPQPTPLPLAAQASAQPFPAPAAKPTLRWAPGTSPEGYPAPAPSLPFPAPRPSSPRPIVMPEELSADALQEDKLSSDGAAAMALSSGPVLPPKPSGVVVNEEPSVVLRDTASEAKLAIAAVATPTPAPAAAEKSTEELDARRRKTVKLDAHKVEQMSAELQAKRAAEAAKAPEPVLELAASPRAARPGATSAPAPIMAEDDFEPPRRSNRSLVIGIVSVVAVIGLLGVAKTMLGGDEAADGPAKTATTTPNATGQAPNPGAAVTATGATTTTLPQPTATPDARPTADPTTTPTAKKAATPPVVQQGVAPVVPVTPKPVAPVPDDKGAKKPSTPAATKGSIVRDVPF